jgi:hypothetical protein
MNVDPMKDQNRLEELFKVARFSRVRTRFPIPVILFNGYFHFQTSHSHSLLFRFCFLFRFV